MHLDINLLVNYKLNGINKFLRGNILANGLSGAQLNDSTCFQPLCQPMHTH